MRMTKHLAIMISLLALVWTASAQSIDPSLDYRIGPSDLISVTVEQDPALNTEGRVGPDGTITMPVVGPVLIGSLTPAQAAARIKAVLEERILTNANVSVVVKQFESDSVSIFGEVVKPGKVPVVRDLTLLQAITATGGPTSDAGQSIKVLRVAPNGLTSQLEIPLQDLLDGAPDVNIPLQANDVISVPHDPEIAVYLLGEVMNPAAVKFKASQRATLLKAIAEAGGFTDRANRKRIEVIREGVLQGEETRLQANVSRIMDGDQPDIRLQDGDRIYVHQSLF